MQVQVFVFSKPLLSVDVKANVIFKLVTCTAET